MNGARRIAPEGQPMRLSVRLMLAFGVTATFGCGLVEPANNCGDKVHEIIWVASGTNVGVLEQNADPVTTVIRSSLMPSSLNGTVREFVVLKHIQGVCTDEHAQAEFFAGAESTGAVELTVTARVDWGILYGAEFPLQRRSVPGPDGGAVDGWTADPMDIGLKQVHGDGPADYWIEFRVSFTSLGNEDRDRRWLENSFEFFARFRTDYYLHDPDS